MILFVCAVIAPVKTRMDQQRKRFCIYLQIIQRKWMKLSKIFYHLSVYYVDERWSTCHVVDPLVLNMNKYLA